MHLRLNELIIVVPAFVCLILCAQLAYSQEVATDNNTITNKTIRDLISSSNITRIEIVLEDEDIKNSSQSSNENFFPVLTAGLTIAGTIAGSFFTHWLGKRIEAERNAREERKQDIIYKDMRNTVYHELHTFLRFLYYIFDNSRPSDIPDWEMVDRNATSIVLSSRDTLPRHYLQLPFETKVKILKAETLSIVEVAYNSFYQLLN